MWKVEWDFNVSKDGISIHFFSVIYSEYYLTASLLNFFSVSAFYSVVWIYYAMSYQSDIDEQVVILVNYMIINRLV